MRNIATQQLIDIIIKATDEASKVAKQVDSSMRKIGDTSSQANQKAAKSTYEFNKKLLEANNSLQVVGGGAVEAANLLHQMKLDPSMGNSIDRAKLKVSEMGVGLDTVKGKIAVFKTVATPAFDSLKNKISNVTSSITGKFSTALTNMRSKIAQLSIESSNFGNKLMSLKGILENTLGSFVYDFAMGVMQSAKASINAASQIEYFGQRLSKVQGDAHLSGQAFQDFKADLGDLQKEFRKVDMTSVGATAEELALKMNLPAEKLGDLTRMTAVLSSTFVKEGRSQEDAVLAVGDALDGQFKRLQEIGITQQELKDNGWSGDVKDQTTLIDALNKTMAEMGYEQTAKDITNLNEAYDALSIAMGSLLQSVLVPLTPPLIQIVYWLLQMGDAIGGVINAFGSFIGAMPDWAQIALGVTGLSVAVALLGTYLLTSVVPGMVASTIATLNWVAGALGAEVTAFTLSGAFGVLGSAIWSALAPLLPFIAAAALLAVAVYEVGKYFGWWTDIGSMVDAISAGVQRLWSAFINHPDVQGMLSAISYAFNWLAGAVGNTINWIGSFFVASSPGKFDIVRALINALGLAWNAMTLPIRTVISVVKLLWNAIKQWYTTTRTNVQKVRALFGALPGAIRGLISGLVNIITSPFKNAYNGVKGAVDKIKSVAHGITNINISSVTNKIAQPFQNAYNKVKDWVNKMINKAKSLPSNIPIIGGMFGGADLAYGGADLTSPTVYKGNDDINVNMNQTLNLILDLKNVPSGVDENMLYGAIETTLNSKEFIDALVSNPDFQTLDGKVKARINAKRNRTRGV